MQGYFYAFMFVAQPSDADLDFLKLDLKDAFETLEVCIRRHRAEVTCTINPIDAEPHLARLLAKYSWLELAVFSEILTSQR